MVVGLLQHIQLQNGEDHHIVGVFNSCQWPGLHRYPTAEHAPIPSTVTREEYQSVINRGLQTMWRGVLDGKN